MCQNLQGPSHLDAHHGIGHGNHRNDENNEFYNYYQWVCFVLFLQGSFFYFPYVVWKNVEKGRLEKMLINVKPCYFVFYVTQEPLFLDSWHWSKG
jgi:hypothetical protein